MLNKLTSVILVATLAIVLCGTSAFANNPSNPNAKTEPANLPSDASAKKDVKPNERLKINVRKLVADAKAGKVAPAERSQIQTAKKQSVEGDKDCDWRGNRGSRGRRRASRQITYS